MAKNKLSKDVKSMSGTKGNRTSGKHKRFSKEEFNQTKAAVDQVIIYHDKIDTFVDYNHDDRYGPDLIEWYGFKPIKYIEVAQRSAWKQGPWSTKWDPVNIEERKAHLFRLSYPCDYWVISKDFKQALVVRHKTVLKYIDQPTEVSNRVIREGEKFIRIPLNECEEIDLNGS